MIIYKATNLINGKIYIGQTIHSLIQRKKNHLYLVSKKNNTFFHNAINKYGVKNFQWEVICICPNIQSLNEQEQYYIVYYDSLNIGYNLQSGGKNCVISDETKKKLSEARIKNFVENPISDEQRKKMSIAQLKRFTEYPRSDETKKKQAESLKKYYIENPMSDEAKEKLSKANKGKNHPMYGKRHSDKTRKKMSEARIKYHVIKKLKIGEEYV